MKKVKYVICIQNKDYPASLELRKMYETLPDPDAERHGLIRIVDESGEDYLYPDQYFFPVEVPETVAIPFAKAS